MKRIVENVVAGPDFIDVVKSIDHRHRRRGPDAADQIRHRQLRAEPRQRRGLLFRDAPDLIDVRRVIRVTGMSEKTVESDRRRSGDRLCQTDARFGIGIDAGAVIAAIDLQEHIELLLLRL